MALIPASAMQLTVLVVLAALFLTFGFMTGVRFANAEHRRDAYWGPPPPAALPAPLPLEQTDPRNYYSAQRLPAPAPVSLTVNVHTAPAPVAPQREYVLNGEVIPALTERMD